ncbi:hypothetical protein F5Y16DRAFT_98618 [Xylariaceae sp. FL0255]|nr:hypothetical protein F5Y16DRAFT_98618 [Xylariaceae sp. FL0255]
MFSLSLSLSLSQAPGDATLPPPSVLNLGEVGTPGSSRASMFFIRGTCMGFSLPYVIPYKKAGETNHFVLLASVGPKKPTHLSYRRRQCGICHRARLLLYLCSNIVALLDAKDLFIRSSPIAAPYPNSPRRA